MSYSLGWYVGARYTRAKRRDGVVSFIAFISMACIALGVAALITILSVMNGFETELRERILGVAPHAVIKGGGESLRDWKSVIPKAKAHPDVVGAAPFVDIQGMLRANGVNAPVLVQGVEPELQKEVSQIASHIQQGDFYALEERQYNVVLGEILAAKLGVAMGDKVTLLVAENATTSIAGVMPRMRRFTVAGVFKIGADLDASLAYIHIDDAARLLRLGDDVSAVRLKVNDLFTAFKAAREIALTLPGYYRVYDWTRTHGNLFAAVKMEKNIMFLILMIIIIVAAFNVVSTLVMTVTDKQADIAILRTLGATPKVIRRIFFVQGAINGVFGTLLGTALGVTLALTLPSIVKWIEITFNVEFLPADVYFISFLPSELHMSDVIKITGCALGLSLLATIPPSIKASKIHPAEALRYE